MLVYDALKMHLFFAIDEISLVYRPEKSWWTFSSLSWIKEGTWGQEIPAKDMMDNLTEVEDENGKKKIERWGDHRYLIMYLNAGHESSGHITMWAAVFLQHHPEIFKKAKEEKE